MRFLYAFSLMCFCLSLGLSADKGCICGDNCKCKDGDCPSKCVVVVTIKHNGNHDKISAKVYGKDKVWYTQPNERASESLVQSLVKLAMCDAGKCPLNLSDVRVSIRTAK